VEHSSRFLPGHAGLIQLALEDGEYAEAERCLKRALEEMPNHPMLTNSLAWHLATCPDASFRKPEQAIELAEGASRRVGHRHPAIWDTLGAAYAATGQFDKAKAAARQAIQLAQQLGNRTAAERYGKRLELYQAGKAYVATGPE
jgi:tetratricopeptide (TPR) repeat protein